MKEKTKTVDFGAPKKLEAQVFHVDIQTEKVQIIEHYGYMQDCSLQDVVRAVLSKNLWNLIAEEVMLDFNRRLESIKIPASRWKSSINKVDRLLGKELCLLAWAVEQADATQIKTICKKWLSLRPEERWWLFSLVAADGGTADCQKRGWRKAVYHGLSGS